MKRKADANAREAAARKAESLRASDKVISDAVKQSEAAKKALEAKNRDTAKAAAEAKRLAEANIKAAEAKKKEQAAAAAKAEREANAPSAEEKAAEAAAIELRYQGYSERTFPVAVIFLLPASKVGGAR